MKKGFKKKKLNGKGLRIGVVSTRWNPEIVEVLKERAIAALHASHVVADDIVCVEVPGAFELPSGAKHLIDTKQVDAVIALGCLVKGSTMHFEYISGAVSQGLMRLALDSGTPVIFGVLTCLSLEQAQERASESGMDHGYEWGLSAVEMGKLVS